MTSGQDTALNMRCINTLRTLAIDMVPEANSGHPGTAMGGRPQPTTSPASRCSTTGSSRWPASAT